MPRTGPVGVGFVGAGMISDTYLENLGSFPDIDVLIVGDLVPERAKAQAEKWGVAQWGTGDDVLAHPDVEVVINLTVPAAHVEVGAKALAAGKHVWSEKPIGIDRESGRALVDQADAAGLLLGIAPDTVLGPGVQSARRAIARGDIGQPLSAQTVLQYAGPDLFHPNPEFLFAPGAGPLFDMGPYYLTTLVHVFGAVQTVAAVGSRGRDTRTIKVGDRAGESFPIQVPTHVSAVVAYEGGGVSQSVFSFDSPYARQGIVEITGTEGTLLVPDPNTFTGDVKITHGASWTGSGGDRFESVWEDAPVTGVLSGRGLGALDLARCSRTGGVPIASGALGLHVLDTMVAIDEAVKTHAVVPVTSTVDPVPLVADDMDPFAATL